MHNGAFAWLSQWWHTLEMSSWNGTWDVEQIRPQFARTKREVCDHSDFSCACLMQWCYLCFVFQWCLGIACVATMASDPYVIYINVVCMFVCWIYNRYMFVYVYEVYVYERRLSVTWKFDLQLPCLCVLWLVCCGTLRYPNKGIFFQTAIHLWRHKTNPLWRPAPAFTKRT